MRLPSPEGELEATLSLTILDSHPPWLEIPTWRQCRFEVAIWIVRCLSEYMIHRSHRSPAARHRHRNPIQNPDLQLRNNRRRLQSFKFRISIMKIMDPWFEMLSSLACNASPVYPELHVRALPPRHNSRDLTNNVGDFVTERR